jgi:riboflavin synthase
MFTGIVTDVGRLTGRTQRGAGACLEITCRMASQGLVEGESVAVAGVCLTVETANGSSFQVTATPETLRKTGLGRLPVGGQVNLERALRLDDRMGGHLVQGHVDGTGSVAAVRPEGISRVLRVSVPGELAVHLVDRGSVAVDGVSLTITSVGEGWFEVTLIPLTLANTTLSRLGSGDPVNLEVDIISKYVARHLQAWRTQADPSTPASWLTAAARD